MAQLGRPFPFGYSFGRAATREECIESAQNTYLRLLAETPGETSLSFNVLALVALQSDGTLVSEKIRDLSRVFRPSRKGDLTLLNFCKSVDSVYKELRLLRASVRNAQKIDNSFERIFNIVFYTIILCVGLALLGLNPLALFLSLSSFALAFSFMISRASSNYFEVRLLHICLVVLTEGLFAHCSFWAYWHLGTYLYSLPSSLRYRRSHCRPIGGKRVQLVRGNTL